MAINFRSRRWNGGWCPDIVKDQNQWFAFSLFVLNDLAFGGGVTEIDEEKIVLRTTIPAGYDIDTFTGTKDEMAPLFKMAVCHYGILHEGQKQIIGGVASMIMEASSDGGVPSLIATMMGGTLVGTAATKAALLVTMDIDDPELAKEMTQLPIEILTVYAHTVMESGLSAREVMTLLPPT